MWDTIAEVLVNFIDIALSVGGLLLAADAENGSAAALGALLALFATVLAYTSYRIGRISGLQLLLYFVALVGSIAALIAILSGSEGLLATAVDRFGILAIGLILLQLIAFMARLDMNLLREEFQLWLDSLRGQRAQ